MLRRTATNRSDVENLFKGSGEYPPSLACSKCSTPWMIFPGRIRLIPCPRSLSKLRPFIRKEAQGKKISRKVKLLLKAYSKKTNILCTTCRVCNFEYVEAQPLPHQPTPVKLNESQEIENKRKKEKKKKKKNKKKPRELNAGLTLSVDCDSVNVKSRKDISIVNEGVNPVSQKDASKKNIPSFELSLPVSSDIKMKNKKGVTLPKLSPLKKSKKSESYVKDSGLKIPIEWKPPTEWLNGNGTGKIGKHSKPAKSFKKLNQILKSKESRYEPPKTLNSFLEDLLT